MNRICLITGGTRGIGRALAMRLLAAEDSVAVTGTSSDGAQAAASALAAARATESTGGGASRVLGVTCDVRDASSVEAAVRATVARFGAIDVLVNNAGVGVGAPVADMSSEEWDRIVDTNLTGVFNCCRAVIPHMRKRGGGWIVNISSLSSKSPFAGGAAYCATKAGLNAFSEALMQEVRHDGIRVAYVLPGSVATGFSGRASDAGADWKLLPEDVAQVIADLLEHPARSLPSRVEIRPSQPKR